MVNIVTATQRHIEGVAHLFDLYRQFYECDPDLELATRFIATRIRNNESTIFLAEREDSSAMGFVQLYPSFCSVEAVKILILHDLFVESSYRRLGIGEALMKRATAHARECGALRIDLLTAKTNEPGQALYERLGYQKVLRDFFAYSLQVSAAGAGPR